MSMGIYVWVDDGEWVLTSHSLSMPYHMLMCLHYHIHIKSKSRKLDGQNRMYQTLM